MARARAARTAAIVGFGRIAAGLAHSTRAARHYTYATHAQVLAAHPGIDWRGVADPSPAAREQAKNHWDVPFVATDAAALAAKVQPEILVLACPPQHRLEALRAFGGVRAVLVEKPLGRSLAEARAFHEYCEERGILVQVNLLRRGDRTFRDLAAGGLAARIGKTQAVSVVYGNGIRNNGSHLIDVLLQFFGPAAEARALAQPTQVTDASIPGDVVLPFAIDFADGTLALAAPLDFGLYRENAIDIWGTKGRLVLFQETLIIRHYELAPHRQVEDALEMSSDGTGTDLPSTMGDAFWHLYDDLLNALDGGGDLLAPAGEVMRTEEIIEAILTSARDGGARVPVPGRPRQRGPARPALRQ